MLDVSKNWMELRQKIEHHNPNTLSLPNLKQPGFSKKTKFQFDSVFAPFDDQKKVFQKIALPEIERLFNGKSQCGLIFAYGYTNSGKTYSILGDLKKLDDLSGNKDFEKSSLGLVPRIFLDLLKRDSDPKFWRQKSQNLIIEENNPNQVNGNFFIKNFP